MTRLRFTVEGRPVGKERARVGKRGGHTPAKTRAYEQKVGWAAIAAGAQRAGLQAPFSIELKIWYADRRQPDTDNVMKACKDALEGVIWKNDREVTKDSSENMGIDRGNPRVEILVKGNVG